jgi:hypothetical protein
VNTIAENRAIFVFMDSGLLQNRPEKCKAALLNGPKTRSNKATEHDHTLTHILWHFPQLYCKFQPIPAFFSLGMM